MELRTFKIGSDNLNLKRGEDPFEDGVQVCGSPVDGQESRIIGVQNKGEIVGQLLFQLLAEQMSRVLLVCDDGIQRTKNLLRKTLLGNVRHIKKIPSM